MKPLPAVLSSIALCVAGFAAVSMRSSRPVKTAAPDSAKTQAETGRSLGRSGYRVEWKASTTPRTLGPGQRVPVSVTFRNAGDQSWLDPVTAAPQNFGAYAVRLSHRWRPKGSDATQSNDWVGRSDLREPLSPGGSVTLEVTVTAPGTPGEYTLEFDLVQELVDWFQNRGSKPLQIQVTVR